MVAVDPARTGIGQGLPHTDTLAAGDKLDIALAGDFTVERDIAAGGRLNLTVKGGECSGLQRHIAGRLDRAVRIVYRQSILIFVVNRQLPVGGYFAVGQPQRQTFVRQQDATDRFRRPGQPAWRNIRQPAIV